MDRLTRALKSVVDLFTAKIDYCVYYPSTVYSQDADGSLQVFPDTPKIPKFAGVALKTPFPETKVEVQKGTRVLLGFENGDPDKPFAALWDGTVAGLTLVTMGDSSSAQYVALANLVLERLDTIKNTFDQHVHGSGTGPTSPPQQPMPALESVACTKLKVE